ncbi:TPA: DUF551 domain-containing protein [Klebsiella pneumoniae]|nr:DUF551 domain-containing protein [Klebsiella pneumoniae]
MSEFSRETLLNIIETDHVQCGEASVLARMALAAMDSEPVAYIFKHPSGKLFWALTDESNKGRRDVMPVYVAPQPAPVVMDDTKLRELFDSWFASDCSFDLSPEASEADNIAWRESYWYVWKRCRAAMLAAAPQSPGSELATVPGKWIPVSERMPEDDVSVLTFDGMYKRVHHAMYGHWQCWEPEKITHWMPLPAAPQEVKP